MKDLSDVSGSPRMPLSNMMPAPLLRSPATRHGAAFAFALAACIASAAGAQPTDADFIAARDAYRAGDSARLERVAPRLKDHLLEPYVAYWQLKLKLDDADPAVVRSFLDRYADLPRSVAELHEQFCAGIDQDMDPEGRIRLINGEPTINFGRHRGRTLQALSREEPGVLKWILKGDFSRFVKEIVGKFLPKDESAGAAKMTPPADLRPTIGSLFPQE